MLLTIILFSCSLLCLLLVIIAARIFYRLADRTRRETPTIEIAVLGPSGVGKTLFLSTLVRQLTEAAEVHDTLLGKYLADDEEKNLREINAFEKDPDRGYYLAGKRNTRQISETELKRYEHSQSRGTEKPENFYLEIWGKLAGKQSQHYNVRWRDIPGGYFEVQEDWRYNGVTEILSQACGVFLLVDSLWLVHNEENMPEDEKIPLLGFQNYVEAISYRLRIAKKRREKFPVWLIFSKGDLLPEPLQQRSEKDWLVKTSQVSALADFESDQIQVFATLVSIKRLAALVLYRNIGATMKRFYQIILEELQKHDHTRRQRRQIVARLLLVLGALLLFFSGETIDSYRWRRLPVVRSEEIISPAQAARQANQLCAYIDNFGLIGFHWSYRHQARQRLQLLQKKLQQLLEEKINNLQLEHKRYRPHLQIMMDMIAALQRCGLILDSFSTDFHRQQDFVNKLKQWDQLLANDGQPPERQSAPQAIVAFYRRLPERQQQLREKVKKIVLEMLERLLEEANEEAISYTGREFYPQRLRPLIVWYKNYGSCFPQLHEKYYRYLNTNWEYCWKRFLQDFEAQTHSRDKVNLLQRFRKDMPEQTFAYQKCPDYIVKAWRRLAKNQLSAWEPENEPGKKREKQALIEWFKPYLSEVDALLVESRQFEKEIESMVQRLFAADKEKGALLLAKIISRMEEFFQKYRQEKRNQEILGKWQERYQHLKNFQSKREVKLIVKEYSCSKNIPPRLWDDSTWESLYLYLRIEIEGMPPMVLDLREGNLSYSGSHSIGTKILWKPWLPIKIKFMDADGSLDKDTLVDDDVLHTFEFDKLLSIIDLCDRRIVVTLKEDKPQPRQWQFSLKIDLVDAVVPQWLLDLYYQHKTGDGK